MALTSQLASSDQKFCNLFGRGLTSRPPFDTVQSAVLHHESQRPNALAVKDLSSNRPRTLTYADLIKYSSYLANKLRDAGIRCDTRVPLVARRSMEMIVGVMGILMSGAQYVPLDGGVVPDQTLEHVIRSTNKDTVILVLGSLKSRVYAMSESRKVLVLEDIMSEARTHWNEPEPFRYQTLGSTNSGCYVIYTSGTTGKPKGVDVTHANVTNLVCTSPGNVGMQPGMKVGSVLSISFDMGAWEILGGLCNGCTLVLRGSDWAAALKEVDVFIATPTILSRFEPTEYPNIQFVATAGEPLPQRTADAWTNAGKILFSGCGPTEVTIVNTIHRHTAGQPVTIGKPTSNNSVYVLDEHQSPVPVGQPGIMWAGGAGVSRGYIGLPDKTAERWKYDPFADNGSLMFNTGDLGYWLPDGSLQIIGRLDDQVKIKGFRVELDGVSASLASCRGVSMATVLMVDDKLWGFVTPSSCDVEQIKRDMKSRQPYYAIPSSYCVLGELPTTPNGKVDRKALRERAQRESTVSIPSAIAFQESEKKMMVISTVSIPETASKSGESHISNNDLSLSKAEMDEDTSSDQDLPAKTLKQPFRGLRHRMFIVYRTIFSLVWISNIAALLAICILELDQEWLTRMSYINLTMAVLVRQDYVINALYTITCSAPKSWPFWIRRRCAKIYHLGGLHSGAASAAVAWYVAGIAHSTWSTLHPVGRKPSTATLSLSWLTLILLSIILVTSWPSFRKSHHNIFELVHRFVGWTALGLFWALTITSINDMRDLPDEAKPLGQMVVSAPTFWLLVVITISIATSWLTLRKVRVEAEVLSDHAVRLHFDYAVPINGCFARLSERPLIEWHSFATIGAPEAFKDHPKGFSLVVSNAGDWTRRKIERPPTKLWVRGIPTFGVMRIATLFNRIVLVGTGSGIGPLLGFIQHPTSPFRLIWSTKSPTETFGPELCREIRQQDPNAIIHDTRVLGRPDLVHMAWNAAREFDAEAVIIIANQKITKKVVYGLETRGLAAYGAIWDS